MKTIYITEAAEEAIKDTLLLDKVPQDVMYAVIDKKTSLGKNPIIPNIYDEGFIEKIVEKRFNEVKDELKKIGVINDVEETTPETALNHLISICQELERPIRPQLEKICYNNIVNLFEIPEDTLDLTLSIRDKVDVDGAGINLDPTDGDDELEFADIVDAESIKGEVFKRRFLDALIMGGAIQLSSNIKAYISEIYDLNPRLIDLYRKILALNNYLLFTKEDIGLTEENKRQIGIVKVILGNDIKKTRIEAQGVIFPILLSEAIRGLFELFIAHGLPKDKERAEVIIGKSDFLKMEPWDMRLGPSLWNIFTDNFDTTDTTLLPFILAKTAKLPVSKFNIFFKEVLSRTRKGQELTKKLIYKSKEQKNSREINNLTTMTSVPSKSIISDNIYADEL